DIGLVDAASLLQESTAATGLQIDTTFNGFVLDNGPGASTIDLRGLGASRTLVLVNGRRLGASGVEGAPGVPDLNLIPSSLIDRIDVLLDGASSIYGSDAVAGVANVILRKDFDGFEIEGSVTAPTHEGGGGGSQFVSANWGTSNDRGFMGFGAEWSKQDNLKLNDRPDVFGDCQTDYEETTTGEIRTLDIASSNGIGVGLSPTGCQLAFGINRIWLDPFPARDVDNDGVADLPAEFGQFGSLYYTPGSTNVGVPNYSESSLFGFEYTDPITGISSPNILTPFYQGIGYPQERVQDVLAETETFSAFTYGEYGLGDDLNTTAFFEAMYSNRQFTQADERSTGFFATAPGTNAYNPCNPDAVTGQGVDCGTAFNNAIASIFGGPPSAFGLVDAFSGARPAETQVRVNLQGDDNINTAEVAQFRMVAGLKGDLPIDNLGLSNWSWEASASYDRSTGQSRTTIFNDERLALSLATSIEDPSDPGNVICGLDANGDGIPEQGEPFPLGAINTSAACVPVNIFSPTLFALGGGDFATQEEYDYLISRRTFNTIIEQTIFQAVATGDLFDLPAGTAAGVIGVEYREDSLDSQPDDVARNGTALGFFSDRGASGTRDLMEAFGEIEVPLLAGEQFAEELTVNGSARWTEESNFGAAWTYSLSGMYRPVNWLTFRSSFGTSYRAPNLREQFIQGQSGFRAISDPCVVPESALGDFNEYIPSEETREQTVLDNCIAAGIDPTTLGAFTSAPSVEVFTFRGGTLQEETSESLTAGFVVEQPFFDSFDLTLAATYYDVEIEDTIIERGAQGIVDDCFIDQPNQASALCSLIRRSATTGFIDEIDTPFINQDSEIARGIDFGILYEQEFNIGAQELSIGLDADVNYTIERTSIVRAPGADPVSFKLDGTIYNPEWQGVFRAFADYGDFRLTWNTNWTGEQETSAPDAFGFFGNDPGEPTADTCLGAVNGDVDCRDVGSFDNYFLHSASVRYSQDTWTAIIGVSNVFDEEPQRADPDEFFEVRNSNIPFGQDFIGRSIFVNLRKSF
ncbi:MAG: TonB-dependent receptor, partial [Hyphomonas sp.]|nr:TonB-dependent receptor [Hyphomonas sp.]